MNRDTAIRFAGVGVINTLIDIVLFMLLHASIGILAANFISTSVGMTFSFMVNGLFTFRSRRLTLRQGLCFLGVTGSTMWLIQPLAIYLVLSLGSTTLIAKILSIGVCTVLNFTAYRVVVWPNGGTTHVDVLRWRAHEMKTTLATATAATQRDAKVRGA